MPSIPDHGEVLASFGLELSGLAIEYTAAELSDENFDELERINSEFEEIKNYFSARGVIATLAWGSDYGSNAKFVGNFAWWYLGDDVESTPIASTKADGTLIQGQEAEAFIQGLAHSLRRPIVVDDEVRYLPGEPDGEEVYLELERADRTLALAIVPGRRPFGAYNALLRGELPGQYGITESAQIIVPAQGYEGLPPLGSEVETQVPSYQFLKRGKARHFELKCDEDDRSWVFITCAPNYVPAQVVPEGSDAHRVIAVLSEPARIQYSEDAPKAVRKSFFGRKDLDASLKASAQFKTLRAHFDPLSRVAPEKFFSRVCALLDLPDSTREVVAAFEKSDPATQVSELGGFPLTTITPPVDHSDRHKLSLHLAIGHLITSFPQPGPRRDPDKQTFLERSRQNKAILGVMLAIPLLITVGAAYVGISNPWDLSVLERIITIPVALLCGALTWSHALIISKFDEARELLRQAKNDGVIPWEI